MSDNSSWAKYCKEIVYAEKVFKASKKKAQKVYELSLKEADQNYQEAILPIKIVLEEKLKLIKE